MITYEYGLLSSGAFDGGAKRDAGADALRGARDEHGAVGQGCAHEGRMSRAVTRNCRPPTSLRYTPVVAARRLVSASKASGPTRP